MRIFYKITFILISLVLLNACSGSDSSATVTTTATVATLANSTATVSENAKEGDLVGTLSITSTGDSAITAITLSGTGSTNFLVSTDGEMSISSESTLDYETTTAYNLTAIATNSVGNSASVSVNITVSDIANYPTFITELQVSDSKNFDYFGASVSVSGDYIAVGATQEDNSTVGKAYLYKKQTDGSMTELLSFQADDNQTDGLFGMSISMSGDYISVGAEAGKDGAETVYVFKRYSDTNVTQIAKVTANDTNTYTVFGLSTSMSGDYIVSGAFFEDANATITRSGAVHVFKRHSDSNVSEIANLRASDFNKNDYLGISVAIYGEYIVAGAIGVDSSGTDSGAVYVFKINSDSNISQIAKLTASDAADSDGFGQVVAMDGNTIIVDAGYAVYAFKLYSDTNITEIASFTGSDTASNTPFGTSVSVSGDYIVVGDSSKDGVGATYVFKINSDNSVTEVEKISGIDISSSGNYGDSVSIDGNNIAVGAPYDSIVDTGEGSVHIYDMEK